MAKESKAAPRRRAAPATVQGLEVRARAFEASSDDGRLVNLLSESDQAELARIATVLDYPTADMPVYREAEPLTALYTVAKGVVRISRHNEEGERQVLGLMWPGDLFGLAEEGVYINSADTLAPTTLFRFDMGPLRRLLLDAPQLQMHLLMKAYHDLRIAQRHVIVLGLENATQRLASFLVDLTQQVEVYDHKSCLMRLPLARADIADYLGLATETVTRGLSQLEKMGLVERQSPRLLRIRKLAGLIRFARAFGD